MSNIAGIGSSLDAELRKSAASTEEAFQGAGSTGGLAVWRIEKFHPKIVEKSEHGVFYTGDSYIVLNTIETSPGSGVFMYDLFYWLGKNSTQDELGAAAMYTVNLDDLLGGKPIQHREVQGAESQDFIALFGTKFLTVDGGVESGFMKAGEDDVYTSKLFKVRKAAGESTRCDEVPLEVASMNKGDVFILDSGDYLFQWNGPTSNAFERAKASEQVLKILDMRANKVKVTVIEGEDIMEAEAFWKALGVAPTPIAEGDDETDGAASATVVRKLFQVHDNEEGHVAVDFKAEGDAITREMITPDDVWLVYLSSKGAAIYAGPQSSRSEMMYFTYYVDDMLKKAGLAENTPVSTFSKEFPEEKFAEYFP